MCIVQRDNIKITTNHFYSNGATKQNRTAGLRVTNPSLYQLSYSGNYIHSFMIQLIIKICQYIKHYILYFLYFLFNFY